MRDCAACRGSPVECLGMCLRPRRAFSLDTAARSAVSTLRLPLSGRLRKNRGQTAHFARPFPENQRLTLRNGCQTMSDPGFSWQVAEKPRSDSPFRSTVPGESAAYVAKWVSDHVRPRFFLAGCA